MLLVAYFHSTIAKNTGSALYSHAFKFYTVI